MKADEICESLDGSSLQMLCIRMSHLFFAKSYEQITHMGLHPGQIPMLRLLSEKGGLSQREISQKLHVKPPSVAVSIRRMESAGLITKCADQKDQRITRISLSEKGKEASEQLHLVIEKNEEVMFRGFTESECCLMRRFLAQIINNMKEMDKC